MARLATLSIFATIFLATTELCAEPAQHWAYVRPHRAPLPSVRLTSWPRNSVDYFVLAKIESAGLAPSDEADPATLARRVTLDLTGLPPELVELNAHLSDRSPAAFDRLVTRLISSPRYGERMAQYWLDAARYADTHGYLIDSHREMWRWRDWVIDAYNDNMPFDQFTIEQLAGDLLPNATVAQQIASGFNRNHMINYENGAIAEQYRAAYVADRVVTTGTVWLGQTLDCARCHDHKYDPISMREFYQLFAFFNNVSEEGLDGNRGNAGPMIAAPTAEQRRRDDMLKVRIAQLEKSIDHRRASAGHDIAVWEATAKDDNRHAPPRDAVLYLPLDSINGQSTPAIATEGKANKTAVLHGQATLVGGKLGQSLLLDGHSYVTTDEVTLRAEPAGFSVAAWLFPTTADRMVIA